MDLTLVLWATWAHNLFFVLFVLAFLAHMTAILIRPNRPMIRAKLTGWIRRDYAEHRHPLWVAEMLEAQEKEGKTPQEGNASKTSVSGSDGEGMETKSTLHDREPSHQDNGRGSDPEKDWLLLKKVCMKEVIRKSARTWKCSGEGNAPSGIMITGFRRPPQPWCGSFPHQTGNNPSRS
jgi:hypothetical protein